MVLLLVLVPGPRLLLQYLHHGQCGKSGNILYSFITALCFCERDKVRICFQGKLEMCGRLYRLRFSLIPRPFSKEERVGWGSGNETS